MYRASPLPPIKIFLLNFEAPTKTNFSRHFSLTNLPYHHLSRLYTSQSSFYNYTTFHKFQTIDNLFLQYQLANHLHENEHLKVIEEKDNEIMESRRNDRLKEMIRLSPNTLAIATENIPSRQINN